MTMHKLTAGDGYQYLIRQVAAVDSTSRGKAPLIDYYSSKGESPGHWVGSGLASLESTGARWVPQSDVADVWAVEAGSQVSEAQMKALFGEGLHPNADAIAAYVTKRGVHGVAAGEATKLGRRFYIRDGENTFARALAVAYRDHNEEVGAHWNAPIDAPTRAAIRTVVARRKFAEQYGRAPADDRELTGYIARETRARTTAVAGYDLTFSPVKSVSALWAIAPMNVAAVVEECHDAAVADALTWLESHAAFTRSGTNGVAQVDTTGLLGAAFTHRDSRAGDPDLHTHVAISNKVATVDASGVMRWLALDGQPVHRFTVAASELYNTRLEAHLGQRLSLRFADVPVEGRNKRPIREIVGMSNDLMTAWSSRRIAIESRTGELAKHFHATHGREPTHVETIALAQQATLETRDAKHEPRSLAEQRHTWRTQAVEVAGGVEELTAMLGSMVAQPNHWGEQVKAATGAGAMTERSKLYWEFNCQISTVVGHLSAIEGVRLQLAGRNQHPHPPGARERASPVQGRFLRAGRVRLSDVLQMFVEEHLDLCDSRAHILGLVIEVEVHAAVYEKQFLGFASGVVDGVALLHRLRIGAGDDQQGCGRQQFDSVNGRELHHLVVGPQQSLVLPIGVLVAVGQIELLAVRPPRVQLAGGKKGNGNRLAVKGIRLARALRGRHDLMPIADGDGGPQIRQPADGGNGFDAPVRYRGVGRISPTGADANSPNPGIVDILACSQIRHGVLDVLRLGERVFITAGSAFTFAVTGVVEGQCDVSQLGESL
jgi:conjugative relaxase-like TrwC/TraI family protein